MPVFTTRVTPLILEELARGERRVLSLVVAVGKTLKRSDAVKGNLMVTIKSALRALVASKAIVDTDGMYSLPPRKYEKSRVRMVTGVHSNASTAMVDKAGAKGETANSR